jgi:hypothetical protein
MKEERAAKKCCIPSCRLVSGSTTTMLPQQLAETSFLVPGIPCTRLQPRHLSNKISLSAKGFALDCLRFRMRVFAKWLHECVRAVALA